VDLPAGGSVKDEINPDLSGLQYNAIADGLLWILQNNDQVMGIPCLDDFLLFGPDLSKFVDSLHKALAVSLMPQP